MSYVIPSGAASLLQPQLCCCASKHVILRNTTFNPQVNLNDILVWIAGSLTIDFIHRCRWNIVWFLSKMSKPDKQMSTIFIWVFWNWNIQSSIVQKVLWTEDSSFCVSVLARERKSGRVTSHLGPASKGQEFPVTVTCFLQIGKCPRAWGRNSRTVEAGDKNKCNSHMLSGNGKLS